VDDAADLLLPWPKNYYKRAAMLYGESSRVSRSQLRWQMANEEELVKEERTVERTVEAHCGEQAQASDAAPPP
jgi:hypothetical protein